MAASTPAFLVNLGVDVWRDGVDGAVERRDGGETGGDRPCCPRHICGGSEHGSGDGDCFSLLVSVLSIWGSGLCFEICEQTEVVVVIVECGGGFAGRRGG